MFFENFKNWWRLIFSINQAHFLKLSYAVAFHPNDIIPRLIENVEFIFKVNSDETSSVDLKSSSI